MKPLSLNKPHLIVMVGIPGSGKSFFVERFAETFNAPLISHEKIRSQLYSQPTFSDQEDRTISQITDYMLDELLKTKQTILFEGASWSRAARQELSKKAAAEGYRTMLVWIQTELSTARSRATRRGRDKTPLSAEQFDHKVKHFSNPAPDEKAIVISGKHTYASQLKIVLKKLTEPRARLEDKPASERIVAPVRSVNIR